MVRPSSSTGRPTFWNKLVLVVVLVHDHHGHGVLAVASQQHPHHSIAITNSSSSSRRERLESMEGLWQDVWTNKRDVECRFVESSMITTKTHLLWNESSSSLRTADVLSIRVGLVLCSSKKARRMNDDLVQEAFLRMNKNSVTQALGVTDAPCHRLLPPLMLRARRQ
jgi:hypothetical protein